MEKERVFIEQGNTIIINSEEYELLAGIFQGHNITIDQSKFNNGFVEFPKQYVGIIELPNRIIIIKPKVFGLNLSHIMRMYYFVFLNNKVDLDEDIFGIDNNKNLSISELFINELMKIVKIGLPMQYKDFQTTSKFSNGTLDLLSTVVRLQQKKDDPFAVHISNLSKDIEVNRVLYLAYRKIYDLVNENVKGFLDRNFQNISRIDRVHNKPMVTRNIKYCEKALTLAYIIINDMSVSGFGESGFGENILINFDKLFEYFVQKVLIVYTDDNYFTTWNEPHYFGEYNSPDFGIINKTYLPDLLYNYRKTLTGGKCTCILDMKNKTSSPFSNADVYQMCFYSSMLKTNKVILCYPSSEPKESLVLNLGNEGILLSKINAVYINLAGNSATEFKNNIYSFIKKIYRIIE